MDSTINLVPKFDVISDSIVSGVKPQNVTYHNLLLSIANAGNTSLSEVDGLDTGLTTVASDMDSHVKFERSVVERATNKLWELYNLGSESLSIALICFLKRAADQDAAVEVLLDSAPGGADDFLRRAIASDTGDSFLQAVESRLN